MFVRKTLLAAAIGSVAAMGIVTTADAQWRGRYYDSRAYYSSQPYGYYDEDATPVYVAPRAGWYEYNSPGRSTACLQDQRDFAERTNFRCR
jgi:hypothetical protein